MQLGNITTRGGLARLRGRAVIGLVMTNARNRFEDVGAPGGE
jgi:hypothetical protein